MIFLRRTRVVPLMGGAGIPARTAIPFLIPAPQPAKQTGGQAATEEIHNPYSPVLYQIFNLRVVTGISVSFYP